MSQTPTAWTLAKEVAPRPADLSIKGTSLGLLANTLHAYCNEVDRAQMGDAEKLRLQLTQYVTTLGLERAKFVLVSFKRWF